MLHKGQWKKYGGEGKRTTDNGRRDVINVLRYLKDSYVEDRSFSKFKLKING